jgi:type IV secretion system protein VirB11
MLSLFKEDEKPISKEIALKRAKEILSSFLNKGLIPSWEEFYHELPLLGDEEDLIQIQDFFQKLTTWKFLEPLILEDLTEMIFHSPNQIQKITYAGNKTSCHIPIAEEDWQLWLEIISVRFKQNWNVQEPFTSFYADLFHKKFRITLIHSSTSPKNISKMTLRSLAIRPHDISTFGNIYGLKELVKNKKNVLIAGSTASGKTSILTSLLNEIDPEEHLIVLEDTYEILSPHPNQTRFLSGKTLETSLKSYLAYSLRLSPDRIILGEMRSHEVIPFLMAMNTGHKGLMGTIHASTAADALNRIALLFSLYSDEVSLNFEKVMELVCRNLEYVVFMENKKVKEIIKILGSDKGIPFFEIETDLKERDKEFNLF